MGNRQSSPQDPNNNQQDANNNSQQQQQQQGNNRGGYIRPASRLQSQRDVLRSAVIPVNDNQRRDERRARRERIREQQLNGGNNTEEDTVNEEGENAESASLLSTALEAMNAAAALRNSNSNNTTNEQSNISPFSRMIASVISEAVITSFRNGHIPTASNATPEQPVTNNNNNTTNTNVRQQLTMHLSPEVFQQMEPGSTENSFMRFMRLPVIVTSVSTANTTQSSTSDRSSEGETNTSTANNNNATTTAVNVDGQAPTLSAEESEVTRIIMLPVFLYGIRSSSNNNNSNTTLTAEDSNNNAENMTTDDVTTQPIGIRRSARIRAANEAAAAAAAAAQQQAQQQQSSNNGQWTVYIISGPNVDGIMGDNASYEELLDLASIIGPARLPTVSQELIDTHVPIVKYTQEVKQTIVGNSEGCQICLTGYQSQDNLRILACHHGFHDDCICKWLTQGRNQCPLCRDVPIPSSSS